MKRRDLLLAALAAPFASVTGASAGDVDYLADMHFHLFFFGEASAEKRPLWPLLSAGNVTLASWSLVGDLPWIQPTKRGLKQKGKPDADRAWTWLGEEADRAKAHLAGQGLKLALLPEDVDHAVTGDPHVVLAVEGATFLAGDASRVQQAYDLGIRSLQLVHYVENPLGDFQTEKPEHSGLTELGRQVIAECNRLGMLVDLAHMTSKAVQQALAAAKQPVVWSHSSVTKGPHPDWTMPVGRARQLTLEDARAIANKGGVVGLWALGSDIGRTPEAYAARAAELASWLGYDHVGFGTDLNALANPAIASYADLARAMRHLRERGLSEESLHKLAMGNYARVLRGAMAARQT